jgi:GT2 family glycosyltransferase
LKIAVVILNYNGEKLLPQFLPSVIQHSANATILVADNASTDNSINLLEKDFPQVTLIKLDKNYGFCGGYNRALQQIEAEYYVLLNSDVEVTANWLTPMMELLENDKTIAAVQPKILAWHKKEYFEYAGAGGGFIDWLGYPFCRGRLFESVEKDEGQYNDVKEVFWATGACLMIRSNIYHTLGGLDEDFFAHMEEIDLCWRIQRSGQKVFYTGKSTVFHVGAGTLSHSNPRKTYFNFRNGLSLLYKNSSPLALWVKFPIRLVLDYTAALLFLIKGEFQNSKAVFRAHVHFFKDLHKTTEKREQLKSLPFTTKWMYKGIAVFDYFLLRKKKISM